MRAIVLGLAVAFALAATPARADERADLARDITTAAVKAQEPQLTMAVPILMRELGAPEAGLTPDETKALEVGLTKTLSEVMESIISTSLNDPAKFEVSELREVKTFINTRAGAKWTGVLASADTDDPELMKVALASMFKNIDMKIFAKLAIAANAKRER